MPSLLTLARVVCGTAIALSILALFPAPAHSGSHEIFNPAVHIDEGQVIVWN